MPAHPTFDIAIVGGGLVGAALALSLKQSDLSIAIIDQMEPSAMQLPAQPGQSVNDFEPRVSALTQASVGWLTKLGAWSDNASDFTQSYQKMQVWDELGTAEINFDAADFHCANLGCIVENNILLAAMHDQMRQQKNVTPFWRHRLSGLTQENNLNKIQLDDQTIYAKLVVGADGANSRVRQLSGLATREWDYEHQAIVCTVETEYPHGSVARQRFSEYGPLAFLPLRDAEGTGHFSSIVWSLATPEAQRIMASSEDAFLAELERAIEGQLGQLKAVSKRFSFPLRQRHAKHYVKDNLALIGDAAHTIHPLAGQGVNLGFKDARVLGRLLLQNSKQGHTDISLVMLKRYQRERQGDNLLMMGAMEGFKQLFGNANPVLRWARNAGLDFVNKQSLIKNQLAKHAMGL